MPFDGLPQGLLSDMARLRVALDGVRGGQWCKGAVGLNDDQHCAIGWLLVATDWDRNEATRLAIEYVYPALPEKARRAGVVTSIYKYNDGQPRSSIVKLFEDAEKLAEQRAVC